MNLDQDFPFFLLQHFSNLHIPRSELTATNSFAVCLCMTVLVTDRVPESGFLVIRN